MPRRERFQQTLSEEHCLRVTLSDVAKEAGVSIATVSRVLNGLGNVSPETAQGVHAAMRTLGYVPNNAARQLARGRSDLLGLLIRDPINPSYGLLHACLQQECARRQLHLITVTPSVENGQVREQTGLQTLLGLRVGALLVATGVLSSQELLHIGREAPTLSVGRLEPHPEIAAVSYHEEEHGRLLAEMVYEHGHRRVVVLRPARYISLPEYTRAEAMLKFLRERGVAVCAANMSQIDTPHEALCLDLLLRHEATAVMCTNDWRAIKLLHHAAERGYRVPEDFSVTGCDGVMLGLSLLGLATLRIPVEQVAREAVELAAEGLRTGILPLRREQWVGQVLLGATLQRI